MTRIVTLVLALAVVVPFAGCTDVNPETLFMGGTLKAEGHWAGYECDAVVLMAHVPKERVDPFVPAGFQVLGFEQHLGGPAVTHHAAVYLVGAECLWPDRHRQGVGFLAVRVADPAGGHAGRDADVTWYELEHYSEGLWREQIEDIGWSVLPGLGRVEAEPLSAAGIMFDDAGLMAELQVQGTHPVPYRVAGGEIVTFRSWRSVDDGLAFFEYEVLGQVLQGAADCRFRQGSLAAALMDDQCHAEPTSIDTPLGAHDVQGFSVDEFDLSMALYHLPTH